MYSKTRVRVYMYHTMKHIGLKTGTKTLKPKKVIKKTQALSEVIETPGHVFQN